MHDTNIKTATVTVCENMALFGASPERDEFDSRDVWDEDDATEALSEAIRVIVGGVTVEGTQLADEREALLWGFVNMLHSAGRPSRPHRGQDRAGDAGPGARAGRHRGQGLGPPASHRPGAQPRRSQRRLRDHARSRRRRLPGLDRRHLAPAPRIAYEPDRQAHLGGHRRTRLRPRPQGPREPLAPARGNPGRSNRRQGRHRRRRRLEHSGPRPREVRRHDPAARRRPRHREDRRKLGGRPAA